MKGSSADHRLLYRVKCSELAGAAFQGFFEQVMTRFDETFTAVKPMGSAGDWKCDGYSAGTHTVYQCYAPETLTATKTCDKIRADFSGARDHWGRQMERWIFVWNASALPPQVVSLLDELQSQNQDIKVDQFGRDKLWDQIVSRLGHEALDELLGEVGSTASLADAHLRAAKRALSEEDDKEARGLCLEVLSLAEGNEALRADRAEAHEVLAILALNERNAGEARRQLEQMDALMGGDVEPALRANYHRLRGQAARQERKDDEAEAEFRRVIAISAGEGRDDAKLRAFQCAARADLVLHCCGKGEAARAESFGKEIAAMIRLAPDALGGQLMVHAVDALVTLAACEGERKQADEALQLLDQHCRSKADAVKASSLLQRLAGRTAQFFGQPEIALACSELAVEMAQRADRDDFYWAAQFNMAVAFLQQGDTEEANKRLELLLPLLESAKVDNAIKAGVLSLASELASERGDTATALELQERMIPFAADDPRNMIGTLHGVGRKLQAAGRSSEAYDAFEKTARLARDQELPGEARFDILAHLCEAAIVTGQWRAAEEAIGELATLPRPAQFVPDAIERLRKQFEGTRELRSRIDVISHLAPVDAPTLLQANAELFKPLLAWWREIEPHGVWFADKQKAGALDDDDRGLRVLYDYWGGGGASRVMANLRQFAPDHFSPFIQVESLEEVRRAIRMFALVSDVIVLLWKGPVRSQQTGPFVPIDHMIGGAGYIGFFGTILKSTSGIRWVAALGHGAYLPEEVCRFLFKEAAGLLEQGRLLLLPAPAVGCWQPEHGPCEGLLVELTGTTAILNRSGQPSSAPLGFVPFFEDVPISAIVDVLGERPEQTRRLRLALMRKTRELRGHGSLEAGKRELLDEIKDAFAEWKAIHRSLGKKHDWQSREEELLSTAVRFQEQWSPIFMLRQLGYTMSVQTLDSAGNSLRRRPAFVPEEGTPFGSWLMPPGPNILSAEAQTKAAAED